MGKMIVTKVNRELIYQRFSEVASLFYVVFCSNFFLLVDSFLVRGTNWSLVLVDHKLPVQKAPNLHR